MIFCSSLFGYYFLTTNGIVEFGFLHFGVRRLVGAFVWYRRDSHKQMVIATLKRQQGAALQRIER